MNATVTKCVLQKCQRSGSLTLQSAGERNTPVTPSPIPIVPSPWCLRRLDIGAHGASVPRPLQEKIPGYGYSFVSRSWILNRVTYWNLRGGRAPERQDTTHNRRRFHLGEGGYRTYHSHVWTSLTLHPRCSRCHWLSSWNSRICSTQHTSHTYT